MRRFFTLFHEAQAGELGSSGGGGSGNPPPSSPAATGTLLSGLAGSGEAAAGTPPPAAAASGPSWVDADGKFVTGWLDKLPEDLRQNPALTTVPTLEALAKSYVHTKSMVGKKLEAPGENATPEQVAEWKKIVGAPAKPEDYGTLKPEAIPAEQWDGEAETALKQIAHRHHLPPAAVKELVALHASGLEKGAQQFEQQAAAFKEGEARRLQEAWGADMKVKADKAVAFASMLGISPDHPLCESADFILALERGAQLLGGDKLVTGQAGGLANSAERIRDIQDPSSTSTLAREYRGEFGAERQVAAQKTLHVLIESQAKAK